MNKTYATILALVLAAGTAGVLVFFIFSGGNPGKWTLPVAIIGGGVLIMAIGAALYFKRGKIANMPPETAERKRRVAVAVAISAFLSQIPAFTGWIFDGHKGSGGAIVGIAIMVAIFAAVAGVMFAGGKRHTNRIASVPWVVPLILGMMVLGVGGVLFGIYSTPRSGQNTADIIMPFVALGVMLVVFIFVLKLIITGSRKSGYALPDVLPEAGPPTDPRFVRKGYYDGTKLLNQRVWGMPVPVTGRGYFIRGQGKAWLADEVLAFHLYLTRKPLVIPYGIIHGVSTKDRMLVKNRLPGPGLNIVWGRPDMPMVTTIQVTQNRAENEAWAQEIMQRAAAWKEKMAAMQAGAAV
jgi:hypothetical protein